MNSRQVNQKRIMMRAGSLVSIMVMTLTATASDRASMMAKGPRAQRPAPSQFGLGPRASSAGQYVGTLEPSQSLRPRQMQAVRVTIRDAEGHPIDDAEMSIDGGMPQHGHGLPTRPRVTRSLGEGGYLIEGVRFTMGGWWEFKLTIVSPRGADTITFNLDL
jgi:hypothetical protein